VVPSRRNPLLLFERFPELARNVPRFPLVRRPTPVRRLAAMGEELSLPELWLKDDSGGPPVGGNKARKLEFLVGEALRKRRRTLVTMGYLGTNHGLATALAAREAGMDSAVVLIDEVASDHVRDTLLRLRGAGARMWYAPGEVRSVPRVVAALVRVTLRRSAPYWIPPGGSSPLGTLGYVEAGLELAAQIEAGELPAPSAVYLPLGSAGTSAGLTLGLALGGVRTQVRAVRVVDPKMASAARTLRLCKRVWRLLGDRGRVADSPPDLHLEAVGGFEGPGYGTDTPEALAAVALAREAEGLELEVTYTGRTLAALSAAARSGRLHGPVLLWNTFHARGELPPDTPAWTALPRALQGPFRGP